MINWSTLALPKDARGWDLKNVTSLVSSLVAKNLWRLVCNEGLQTNGQLGMWRVEERFV
jgi:hypothetical protein